ncbi:hypothetical protein A3K71_03660 [archaeon RBG_16_50_20]|nr:MAG: hypothetical protein A3K71_03660 [archaeon RBG_16_50_20]
MFSEKNLKIQNVLNYSISILSIELMMEFSWVQFSFDTLESENAFLSQKKAKNERLYHNTNLYGRIR